MKCFYFLFIAIAVILLVLSSCSGAANKDEVGFVAIVLENNRSNLLVQPEKGSDVLRSADKITVYINDDVKLLDSQGKEIGIDDIGAGERVQVFFDGAIAESYPAQIHRCYRVKLLD